MMLPTLGTMSVLYYLTTKSLSYWSVLLCSWF